MSKRSRNQRHVSKKQVTRPASLTFRHTAIASAIAIAIAPIDITAGTPGTEQWGRNIEFFVIPSNKSRALTGGQILQPLFQNNNSLTYADVRAIFKFGQTEEFNFGLGHRKIFNNKWILGAYGSFDTRNSARDVQHHQATFGLEALSRNYDVNFNYYLPISGKETVATGTLGGTFVGSTLFANGVVEEALEGLDIEAGALLPFVPLGETRIYLGAYYFDGDVAASTGIGKKVRLEYRPRKDITLGIQATDDSLFGTEAQIQIKYSFGYAKESGIRTLSERMIQFHERDIDVKETGDVPDLEMESGAVEDRVLVSSNVLHVDNTAAPGGDGSINAPFDDIAAATASAGAARTNAFYYIHEGDGTSTGLTTGVTLLNNQTLFGEGANLFGIGGVGNFPVLTTAGNTVVLANNNEVAGLQIDGAGGRGIYGFNSNGFNIHENRILNSGSHGVALYFDETGPKTVVGEINNNRITDNGQYGIFLQTTIDEGVGTFTQNVSMTGNTINDNSGAGIYVQTWVYSSNLTQNLTIANNRIERNGDDGINVYNYVYGNDSNPVAARLTQNLQITGNTIMDNSDDGIYIRNYVGDDGVATPTVLNQVVNISNNNIYNNDNGIHIYNETDSDASVLNQTLLISNNTITYNSENGIYVDFYNDYFSTINFNGNINNNEIAGNGEDGININFDSYEDGVNNLRINISNNNIYNNGDNGIQIYFDNAYTTSGRQVVNISNNNISNNSDEGIYIETYQNDTGISSQTIRIENNTINDNGNYGVRIYNDIDELYNGGRFSQTVFLFGNTINNNGEDGVRIYNDTRIYDDASFSQNVYVFGNTIRNNSGDGIRLTHYNDGDGIATQTVRFTNNTITGNGNYDVNVRNATDPESVQTVTSGGGNTIGSIYVDGDGTQSVTLP